MKNDNISTHGQWSCVVCDLYIASYDIPCYVGFNSQYSVIFVHVSVLCMITLMISFTQDIVYYTIIIILY